MYMPFLKKIKKNRILQIKYRVLLWDQRVVNFEKDDPCTCAGIKCNCTRNKFLGDFSQPLITGELLDLKKKKRKKKS